jgi:hypothetical protein
MYFSFLWERLSSEGSLGIPDKLNHHINHVTKIEMVSDHLNLTIKERDEPRIQG